VTRELYLHGYRVHKPTQDYLAHCPRCFFNQNSIDGRWLSTVLTVARLQASQHRVKGGHQYSLDMVTVSSVSLHHSNEVVNIDFPALRWCWDCVMVVLIRVRNRDWSHTCVCNQGRSLLEYDCLQNDAKTVGWRIVIGYQEMVGQVCNYLGGCCKDRGCFHPIGTKGNPIMGTSPVSTKNITPSFRTPSAIIQIRQNASATSIL
jgi:hypothetical protein